MKCIVLKEFSGIEEGKEVNVSEQSMKYMVSKGYVAPVVDTKMLATDYQNKAMTAPKNKGGRPSKQK